MTTKNAVTATGPAGRLRELLDQRTPLSAPGGGTPLEALSAAAAGFDAFYVSGYAVAAWRHGLPDLGVTGMTDIVDAATAITASCSLPVIVDADTGYGDVAAVSVTVARLERAGAAAIQFEDQVSPKRCGHMLGKEVIPAVAMERKIAAALKSRAAGTLIIARTDALGPLGIDEAIERGRRYSGVGADAVFVDAPESRQHLERIAAEIPGRLVLNLTESGRTPILPLREVAELGFSLVIYPTAALRLAGRVIGQLYADLRASGGTTAWSPQMMSLDEMNALLGQARINELEEAMVRQRPDL